MSSNLKTKGLQWLRVPGHWNGREGPASGASPQSTPTESVVRKQKQKKKKKKTVLSSLSRFDSVQAPRPQGGTFNPI